MDIKPGNMTYNKFGHINTSGNGLSVNKKNDRKNNIPRTSTHDREEQPCTDLCSRPCKIADQKNYYTFMEEIARNAIIELNKSEGFNKQLLYQMKEMKKENDKQLQHLKEVEMHNKILVNFNNTQKDELNNAIDACNKNAEMGNILQKKYDLLKQGGSALEDQKDVKEREHYHKSNEKQLILEDLKQQTVHQMEKMKKMKKEYDKLFQHLKLVEAHNKILVNLNNTQKEELKNAINTCNKNAKNGIILEDKYDLLEQRYSALEAQKDAKERELLTAKKEFEQEIEKLRKDPPEQHHLNTKFLFGYHDYLRLEIKKLQEQIYRLTNSDNHTLVSTPSSDDGKFRTLISDLEVHSEDQNFLDSTANGEYISSDTLTNREFQRMADSFLFSTWGSDFSPHQSSYYSDDHE